MFWIDISLSTSVMVVIEKKLYMTYYKTQCHTGLLTTTTLVVISCCVWLRNVGSVYQNIIVNVLGGNLISSRMTEVWDDFTVLMVSNCQE